MGQQQRHHRRRSRDILPSLLSGRHSLALTHAHAHNTYTHMRACPSLLLLSLSLSLLFLLFEESCVIWHRNCRRRIRRCHITRRCSVRLRGGKDDSFAPRVPPLPPLPPSKRALFIISFQGAWAHDGHAPAPRACVRLPARPASGVHLAMWATRCDILESDIVPGFAAICHHAAAAADHDDAANVLRIKRRHCPFQPAVRGRGRRSLTLYVSTSSS